MFVVMNRIDVDAERASTFEEHFGANMDTTLGGVPGLVRATLLRPNRDGDPYLATMEFGSEEHFTAWRTSDAFKAAHGGRGGSDQGDGPPVESYTVVNTVGT